MRRFFLIIALVLGASELSCVDENHEAKANEPSKSSDAGQLDAACSSKMIGFAQALSGVVNPDVAMWNKTIEAVTLLCGNASTVPYETCSSLKDEIVTHRDQMVQTKATLDRMILMKK
jgi:hypothetical protein